jgi:hypothetical protein
VFTVNASQMLLTITLIIVGAIALGALALGALEIWLFWQLGELDYRRRTRATPRGVVPSRRVPRAATSP